MNLRDSYQSFASIENSIYLFGNTLWLTWNFSRNKKKCISKVCYRKEETETEIKKANNKKTRAPMMNPASCVNCFVEQCPDKKKHDWLFIALQYPLRYTNK